MTKSEKKTIEKLIREYVFLRDGTACLRCHKTDATLAMSHVYPKGRYRNMELEVDNIKPLCYACHICFFHKNPIEAHEWLQTAIPKQRLDRLKMLSQMSHTAPRYPELKLWLENEIKVMKRKKMTG